MSKATKTKFCLPPQLLWEYDLDRFNYDTSYFIVIERVIQRGNIRQWREAQHYYGKDKFLEVVETSKQLNERDKNFASFYVNSDLNDPQKPRDYQAGNLPAASEIAVR